tara:strand:+ start:12484 stop:14082 length:1599 start_codon:yes stop_codon:yes gene_type:complete
MTLTQIAIENFKGVCDRVEIPLRPITLLFGANSVGKSTVLQALLYFRDLLEFENADADRLIASGASIDLGGFRQFVHKHELSRPVRIEVTFAPDDDGLPLYPIAGLRASEAEGIALPNPKSISVAVEVSWDSTTGRPWVTEYAVALDGIELGAIHAAPNFRPELERINLDHPIFREDSLEEDEQSPLVSGLQSLVDGFELRQSRIGGSESPGKNVIPVWGTALPFEVEVPEDSGGDWKNLEQAQSTLSSILVGSGEILWKELRRIRYLGPLRSVPPRSFLARISPSQERWADGAAAWDLLHRSAAGMASSDLVEQVSDAISDPNGLNLGYRLAGRHFYEVPSAGYVVNTLTALMRESEDVDVEERLELILDDLRSQPQRTQLEMIDVRTETEVAPADIGAGITQAVPIVVGALESQASIFSVEQPELHTHPAVQCSLGDLFARQVGKASDRLHLVETHSEHLLLRMLRRIRETASDELPKGAPELTPELLSVLYVSSSSDGVEITPLPVNEDGDFDQQWPEGFFEERANELF